MLEKITPFASAIAGLCIGIGIMVAGFSIGNTAYKARATERFISVEGVAEREVDADLVVWSITFSEAENDLVALQKNLAAKRDVITKFIEGSGLKKPTISYSLPQIEDHQAKSEKSDAKNRYSAQASVVVRSNEVAIVKKAMERTSELLAKGVTLVPSEPDDNSNAFVFTGLSKTKAEMIEAAAKNAKESADRFAKGSGSKLGRIRTAKQDSLSITDSAPNIPERKQLRLVLEVDYFIDK